MRPGGIRAQTPSDSEPRQMSLRPRTRRALIGTALAACLLALAAAAAASGKTTHRAGTATARCKSSGLVLWLDTQGSGAAGSSYYKLKLTNLSGHSCTLRGYPGVSAVNLAGHQLGSPASREHVGKVKTVTLKQGETATAVLRIVEAGNFPTAKCHMSTAAGLRVYPPGEKSSKVVPFPFPACSRRGTVFLSARAVRGE